MSGRAGREIHADLAGRRARHDLRHGEDVGAGLSLDHEPSVIVVGRRGAEYADTDRGAHTMGVGIVDGQTGMGQGLARGDDRQQAVAIHGDGVPAVDPVVGDLPDLAARLDLEIAKMLAFQQPYRRTPFAHRLPDGRRVIAQPT